MTHTVSTLYRLQQVHAFYSWDSSSPSYNLKISPSYILQVKVYILPVAVWVLSASYFFNFNTQQHNNTLCCASLLLSRRGPDIGHTSLTLALQKVPSSCGLPTPTPASVFSCVRWFAIDDQTCMNSTHLLATPCFNHLHLLVWKKTDGYCCAGRWQYNRDNNDVTF